MKLCSSDENVRCGKRAVVVINTDFSRPMTATVELPRPGKLLVATPEHPEAVPTTAGCSFQQDPLPLSWNNKSPAH